MNKYKKYIREVPDFPEDGISFKDVSPLLKHGNMYRLALLDMLHGHNNELWAGVESRGFLIASGLSQLNGGGVLMIRKPGKLPPPIVHKRYFLEYGQDALEVQPNTEEHKKSVVLVDDVLATGGTLAASGQLLDKLEAEIVGISVLAELSFLQGRKKLPDCRFEAVIEY